MKINLWSFEQTQKLKKGLWDQLKLPENVRLDFGLDTVHALNEVTRSLANLHPHKRSIAVLGAQPPPLSALVRGFAGEGYSIQELPLSLTDPSHGALHTAWEAVKKDTLFVLATAIEPFTGVIFPVDWIRKEASAKSIFSVIYYPPDSLKAGIPIPQSPWEALIADPLWGQPDSLTLILKGERAQGDPVLWGEPNVNSEVWQRFQSALIAIKSQDPENENKVREFETKVQAQLKGAASLLPQKSARLFDRAVIFASGIDGEAVVTNLSRKNYHVSTASACAWNEPKVNDWLQKQGLSPDQIQGSIILPLATLEKKGLEEALLSTISELRALSGAD